MKASKPVWFDLLTPDVASAKKFYTEIFGWKTESFPNMDYDMISGSDGGIGGFMKSQPPQPPSWMAYIGVENVDKTLERIPKLKGKVVVPGTDIPNVGRFGIVSDPQGAHLAVFQSAPGREMQGAPPFSEKPGYFCWLELQTTDSNAALGFYGELFGWKRTKTHDMGPDGEYMMFSTGDDKTVGGMYAGAAKSKIPPHWVYYIACKDVDATAKQVTKLGGKILVEPMDVPGDDRIAQVADPQGVVFGLYAPKKK